MIHIGDMEDAGHRPFQEHCKDPLHTGTEAHREPCKAAHAGDQVSPGKGDRSELRETEDAGEVAASSVSTRPPGGGDGRDLETYMSARRYSCRKNRERIGHSALLSEEIADGCDGDAIRPTEHSNGDVFLPETFSVKAAGKLKALTLFVVVGLRGGAHQAASLVSDVTPANTVLVISMPSASAHWNSAIADGVT